MRLGDRAGVKFRLALRSVANLADWPVNFEIMRPPMNDVRRIKRSRGGRNPGDMASMRRKGTPLVIEPVRKQSLLELLATLEPMDQDFPDVDSGHLRLRDIVF